VRFVVENGPDAVNWLIDSGVDFTREVRGKSEGNGASYHLTQEGGHSHRRILHTADATGKEVTGTLVDQVLPPKILISLSSTVLLTWSHRQTKARVKFAAPAPIFSI